MLLIFVIEWKDFGLFTKCNFSYNSVKCIIDRTEFQCTTFLIFTQTCKFSFFFFKNKDGRGNAYFVYTVHIPKCNIVVRSIKLKLRKYHQVVKSVLQDFKLKILVDKFGIEQFQVWLIWNLCLQMGCRFTILYPSGLPFAVKKRMRIKEWKICTII